MEQKKTRESNLENKRVGFFFVGFVMITALVGMAFEFSKFIPDPKVEVALRDRSNDEMLFDIVEEEIIEEEPEVAPPPPIIEEIEVVDDEEEVPEIDFSAIEDEVTEIPEETGPVIEEEPIYDFVEVEPSFPGGAAEMNAWLVKNITYPEISREMGEEGTVWVKFVVGSDGSVQDVKVVKSVSSALDAEAKRVVKAMPKWTPGEQAGRPVKVNFNLPIKFNLG